MPPSESITILAEKLCDAVANEASVSKELADRLFHYFKESPLFRWADANNDCEDRANAICLLLQQWNIPCRKAWVFSGNFLKKDRGALLNNWNYHVAAALPVKEDGQLVFYVIDPATLNKAETAAEWAAGITAAPNTYYAIKDGAYYIFNPATLENGGWYKQNRQNLKWTIQGLAGINGVSMAGKAQLVFCKKKIENTEKSFRQLLVNQPSFGDNK